MPVTKIGLGETRGRADLVAIRAWNVFADRHRQALQPRDLFRQSAQLGMKDNVVQRRHPREDSGSLRS